MSKTLVKIKQSDKTHMIRYFENGKKVVDIQSKFPEYTRNQLAAVKAHVNMGTYV